MNRTEIILDRIFKNRKISLDQLSMIDTVTYQSYLAERNIEDKDFLLNELDELACLLQDSLDTEILNCKSNLYEDTGIEYEYTDYFLEQDYLLDQVKKLQNLITF